MKPKKILSTILATTVTFSIFSSSVSAVALSDKYYEGYRKGDVNQDLCVNIDDVNLLMDISLSKAESKNLDIEDMNEDGSIDVKDVRLLLEMVKDASNFEKGDVNGDGIVSTEDAEIIKKAYEEGLEGDDLPFLLEIGDMNDDGKIDETDEQLVYSYISDNIQDYQLKNYFAFQYRVGDLNQDGCITEDDVKLALQIYSGEVECTETHLALKTTYKTSDIIDPAEAMSILKMATYPDNYIQGDVNRDGVLTIEDANIILNIVKGLENSTYIYEKLGDMNGDGKISLIDAAKVLTIVQGTEIEIIEGDMNNDGFVNSTDAAIVLDLFKNGGVTEEDLLYGDMNGDNLLNSTDAAMILDIYKNS